MMFLGSRGEKFLCVLNIIIILFLLMITGCDRDSTNQKIPIESKNNPEENISTEEEVAIIGEEEFDWVIEVDDTSEIIPYEDGSRVIGRLRMRLVNRSGFPEGDYVGESMFRVLIYKDDVWEFQGQSLPFSVNVDYTSQTATCNVEATGDIDDSEIVLAPLDPSEQVELAPLAPLIIEGYKGIGENNYIASEFASMINDTTEIVDDETEQFRFIITTEGGLAKIILQHPVIGPFTFTGKMIGYGRESKAADKPLDPFPISDEDETWSKFN